MKRYAASFLAFCLSFLACSTADAQTATTQRVGSIRGPSVSQVCLYRYQSPLICDPFASQNNSTGQITFLNSVIPTPTTVALGGVKAATCAATNFVNGIGTDGAPTCAIPAGGGGGGSPGGSSGQIQVNNAGSFGGVTPGGDLAFNAGTGAFTINNAAVTAAKMAGGAAVGNIGYTPLNPASNLADVGSAPAARSSLGLGTIATLGSGASGDLSGTWPSVVVINGAITAAKMASGAAVGNLGFTPANRAGDTFTGQVNAPSFFASAAIGPGLGLFASGNGTDAKYWLFREETNGNLTLNTLNDSFVSPVSAMAFTRSGNGTTAATFPARINAASFAGDGSALTNLPAGNFTGTGTAPITRSVNTKLDTDLISVADYALSSPSTACANDGATGWANAVAKVGGGTLTVPAGIWCYSGPVAITTNGFKLQCAPGAQILKINSTLDGFTFINGSTTIDDIVLRDCYFGMKAGVTPTAGRTVYTKLPRHFLLDNVSVGNRTTSSGGSVKQSYQGIVSEGADGVILQNVHVWGAASDCVVAYGAAGSFNSEWRTVGSVEPAGCGGWGVHIAGGLGGVSFDGLNQQVAVSGGVAVDRTLYNVTNREIFANHAAFADSNTGGPGWYFAPNSVGVISGAFWGSSNSGDGMQIDSPQDVNLQITLASPYFYGNLNGLNAKAGHVRVTGGTFFANGPGNTGSGIVIGSGVQSALLMGMQTNSNGLYGIDDGAPAGTTSLGPYIANGNGTAPIRSANGFASSQFGSALGLNSNSAQSWNLNSAQGSSVYSVAPGGIVTLAPGSGKIIVNDQTNGHVCEFLVGGGAVTLVGQTSTDCLAGTSSPGANQMSIYFNGSSNYVFKSNQATTRNFTIGTWSTRNSA